VAFFLIFRYFSRMGVLAGTNGPLAVESPFWDEAGQGLE